MRRIRPYGPDDEADVIRIYLAATIPGQSFLPEDFWRDSVPEIRDVLMPVADTWIVEEHGAPVAFMSMLGDVIGGLFTLPEHQGRGHGAALIEHAAARHDPLFVEVFEANMNARRFYAKCGFIEHDRRVEPTSGLEELLLVRGAAGR